jgi:aminoglycoside phosphotransferase (APT) family kinase protein
MATLGDPLADLGIMLVYWDGFLGGITVGSEFDTVGGEVAPLVEAGPHLLSR